MPYEKGKVEVRDLVDLRTALKPYGFSGDFNPKAKENLDTYHTVKSGLKRAKTLEQCDQLLRSMIELVKKAHSDCLEEISTLEKSRDTYTAGKRVVTDFGKGALNFVNWIATDVVGREEIVHVTDVNMITHKLEDISKAIAETEKALHVLEEISRRGERNCREEIEKFKEQYNEKNLQRIGENNRKDFVECALKKFGNSVDKLQTKDPKGFIALLPCTAAYIRILSGIGGVSKYAPEERVLQGGFIGRLYDIIALLFLARLSALIPQT